MRQTGSEGVKEQPDVWVVGQFDQGWKAEIIYPGTIEGALQALRLVNSRGYGEVRPVQYGEEIS